MALRLVPGVRERHSRPRFLTIYAVSLAVCSEFGLDEVAKDGVSEPWQVFEWYVVEGLVRSVQEKDQLGRLPGREKAAQAIRDGVPLSASRYLKLPSVFGFHGVYRVLARELGIECSGRLGDFGYELLSTWMEEEGQKGFYGSEPGPGAKWHDMLVSAVKKGLEKGAVAQKGQWPGWKFFGKHLHHIRIGKKEGRLLENALLQPSKGHRDEILRFICSPNARDILALPYSERRMHENLRRESSPALSEFLDAIMAYETFSRALQDAFDDCLYFMSRRKGKTLASELASMEEIESASRQTPLLYERAMDLLSERHLTNNFIETYGRFADKQNPRDWVVTLLRHHDFIQRRKPPNGKRPWFETMDDGSYYIRTGYIRSGGGRHDDEYVGMYRTGALVSFAGDLELID